MANSNYQILSSSDKLIIDAAHQVWRDLGSPENASYNITLLEGGARTISGALPHMSADANVATLAENDTTAMRSLTLQVPTFYSFSLHVNRQTPNPPGTSDQVSFHIQDNIEVEHVVRATIAVRRAFQRFDVTDAIDRALGPELSEFYRRREEGLIRLETLSQQLIEQNIKHHEALEMRLEDDRQRLNQEVTTERDALAADHQRKDTELQAREAELAQLRKELDDRSNTHARRQIRSDLKKLLADRSKQFSLSEDTVRKRWPIHGLFVAWMTTSAILLGRALWNTPTGPWGYVEVAATAISLLGAIGFYIRWNDVWARQHAAEEFRLRRLDLDVDRASWLVEVALEWKEEKGSTIPPELLDRMSQGLFLDPTQNERAQHPVEDLVTALLGASTALKIGVGSSELSLDRKGIKRFQSATNND